MSSYKVGEIAALLFHSKKKSKDNSRLEQSRTLFNNVEDPCTQEPLYVTVADNAPTKVKKMKALKRKRKIGQEQASDHIDSAPFLRGNTTDEGKEVRKLGNKSKKRKIIEKTFNPVSTTQTSQKLPHQKSKKRKVIEKTFNPVSTTQASQKLSHPQQESQERLSRTIFVGNLPINIKKKKLKAIFQPYGQIESLRIRCAAPSKPSLPKKVAIIKKDFHPERSSIQSYVVFKNVEDAHSALQLNATLVMGHHLIVNPAASGKVHNHKNSIFVGNLSFNIEEEELWSAFTECGEIESVRIIRDPTTGMGKGYGFVLFKTTDAATVALQMDGSDIKGRKVRVSRDNKPKVVKKGRPIPFMPRRSSKQSSKNFQGNKFSEIAKKRKGRKELRKKSKERHKKIVAKILNG